VSPDALLALMDRLNPRNEPGRLTLIHRMGADQLRETLPALLNAVTRSGSNVLWLCDPMHGNTETLTCGTKTRRFEQIMREIEAAFSVHREHGTRLGGLHLELTGDDVTECLGGARNLQPEDLSRRYLSKVDPRLNHEQALELALRVAHLAR
jgi:3-deoxy-7-phosphoheptulonate synthase